MALEKDTILSDKEMAQVSGGQDEGGITIMECEVCEYRVPWCGNYMNDEYYPCEDCGEMAMRGIWYEK